MAFPTGWTRGRIDIDHTKVSGTASLTDFPVYLNEDNFGSAVFGNSQGKEINTNYLLDDDNLQGYWRLESSAVDSSGNSNDGTATSMTYATGKFGNAGVFNGTTGRIGIPNAVRNTLGGSLTVSAWIKTDTIAAGDAYILSDWSFDYRNFLFIRSGATIRATFGNGGTSQDSDLITGSILNTSDYFHVAITRSGATQKLFVNGTLDSSQTGSYDGAVTTNDVFLGASGSGASLFDGMIDDVAIWDRALSDEEVLSLYTGGADIRFSSDEAGTREIPREIVNWDIEDEEAEVHVKVPTVSDDTDTTIYVWYDNSSATPIGRELYTFDNLINDANLQGYWRMEDLTDSGPNGYTLTNHGTTTFTTGMFGNSANMNGTDQWLSTTTQFAYTGAQTRGIWFYPTTTDTNQMIMTSLDVAGNAKKIYLWTVASSKVQILTQGATTGGTVTSSNSYIANAWNFVVWKYDPTNSLMSIFLNGVETAVATTGSLATGPNDGLEIGTYKAGADAGYYLTGKTDDAFILDRALSDHEIAGLYGSGRGVWTSDYGAVYHLENNGIDSTTNGYDGTNVGNTYSTSYGKIGIGTDFNSSTAKITASSDLNLTANYTLSMWANIDDLPASGVLNNLIGKYYTTTDAGGTPGGYEFRLYNDAGTQRIDVLQYDGASYSLNYTLSTSTWTYLAVKWDGTNFTIYEDGASVGSGVSGSGNATSNTKAFNIGNFGLLNNSDLSRPFNGKMDEVRVISSSLSSDWIATEYANQNSPSTFATFVSAIERTISDSIGLTDSTDRLSDVIRSVTDSIGVTDTIIKLQGFARALDDNIGMTDLVVGQSVMIIFLSDTMGITDSNDRVSSYAKIIEDSIGVDDTIERQLDVTREVTDSMGLTDSLVGGFVYIRILDDSMTLTDSITLEQTVLSKSKFKVSSVKETRATINRIIKNKPVVLIVN